MNGSRQWWVFSYCIALWDVAQGHLCTVFPRSPHFSPSFSISCHTHKLTWQWVLLTLRVDFSPLFPAYKESIYVILPVLIFFTFSCNCMYWTFSYIVRFFTVVHERSNGAPGIIICTVFIPRRAQLTSSSSWHLPGPRHCAGRGGT